MIFKYPTIFRQELEQLDRSIQECLKELRLIESTSNKKKDDTNVNSLTDLGNKLSEILIFMK